MKDKTHFWITIILVSMIWITCGLHIGYMYGVDSIEKVNDQSKERFLKAVTWAVNEGYVIVNTNRLADLKNARFLSANPMLEKMP